MIPNPKDIALLGPNYKVFTFLLSDALKQSFPSDLTKAYLVGEKVYTIFFFKFRWFHMAEVLRGQLFVFKVGSGTTSDVHVCYRHPNLQRYAVKILNKSSEWDSKYSKPADLRREVEVLDKVNHPCIIQVEEVIETDSLLAIVMEYATGGELFDQVMEDEKAKRLQEDTAKFQFFQVLFL